MDQNGGSEFRSNSLPVYGYTGGAQQGSFSGADGPGGRHTGARAASFIEANRMLAVARAENLDRHPNVKARCAMLECVFVCLVVSDGGKLIWLAVSSGNVFGTVFWMCGG